MVSSFDSHNMCAKVERITTKTGCTSCTNWSISFEVRGFRTKIHLLQRHFIFLTYFNSRLTTGIHQFAVCQGGRQTTVWQTAKLFVVCPCTAKHPSAISSAKRCCAVCRKSTDGKELCRLL